MARAGAAREDGPRRRPELPHGHVGALLRHRPAGGDLVREGRPQLDRHALASSIRCRRRCRRAGSRRATGTSSRRSRKKVSELAPTHFPEPVQRHRLRRRWRTTRRTRSPSREVQDWREGECEADPRQDDAGAARRRRATTANLYNQFISLGPLARDERARRARHAATRSRTSTTRRSIATAHGRAVGRQHVSVARERRGRLQRRSSRFATVTNGELAYRAYENMEEKVGLPLADLAEKQPRRRASTYDDLQAQPRRLHQQPDVVRAHRTTAAPTRRSPTTSSGSCRGAR